MIFQENIYQQILLKRKLHVRYTLNPYNIILLVWYQSFFVCVHWLDNHSVYIQSTLHGVSAS